MSDATIAGNRKRDVWKGLAAGFRGRFGCLLDDEPFSGCLDGTLDKRRLTSKQSWEQNKNLEAAQRATSDDDEQDNATVKAASAVSEAIFNHRLTKDEKNMAGSAVHSSLGTGVGRLYGAVAEVVSEVTKGAGLPFGAAFWLVVDETAVPLLGLSKGSTKYPLSTDGYGLTSHLVYGLTAELVRRGLRKAL